MEQTSQEKIESGQEDLKKLMMAERVSELLTRANQAIWVVVGKASALQDGPLLYHCIEAGKALFSASKEMFQANEREKYILDPEKYMKEHEKVGEMMEGGLERTAILEDRKQATEESLI